MRLQGPEASIAQLGTADCIQHFAICTHVLQRLGNSSLGGRQRMGFEESHNFVGFLFRAKARDGIDDDGIHQGRSSLGQLLLDVLKVLQKKKQIIIVGKKDPMKMNNALILC